MELQKKTPFMSIDTLYSSLINTEYTNYSSYLKDSYALFFADYAENCFYSDFLNKLKDTADCHRIRESELCYGSVGIYKGYKNIFSEECTSCVDILFCKNCNGCTDCFGCVNLQNKSYCIYNKQFSKEEYFDFLKKEVDLKYFTNILKYIDISKNFWLSQPNKQFYSNALNKNTTGNYIYESKNTKESYLVTGAEDSKFIQMISVSSTKDAYDYTCWGGDSEKIYDTLIAGHGAFDIRFSIGSYPDNLNNEYCYYASGCKNAFGCVNLKRKQYCILNKQYSKEEYEKVKNEIIEKMKFEPFIDSNGRKYSYGEFFPYMFSHFSYNETIVQQYFPKNEDTILKEGLKYTFFEPNIYKETISCTDLPDNLYDFSNVLEEIIKCKCGRCFKVIRGELDILKKIGIAIPRDCPECRRIDRFKKVLLPFSYNRKCFKCNKDIKTFYAPESPEIVYCEKCYQQEVY